MTALTGVAAVALTAAGPIPSAYAAFGCTDLAAGPGVFNSTGFEYATNWTITLQPEGYGYNLYLKRTDGSIAYTTSEQYYDFNLPLQPGNNYRLQLQNVSTVTEHWHVCWSNP